MSLGKDDVPSDVGKLLDSDESVSLYMKQKKYHPAIDRESVVVTNKRVIFRKPELLAMKKKYTDYGYADILNVSIEKGPLRSTIKLNLRLDGSDLLVEDIPNDDAELAFQIIRDEIDKARERYKV